ncbi:AzlC family ABC transporter permease [Sulfobacillus thermosulfidooxidans]|uniref:AzlC family ABC transporter permease n=1 Tax=Sulfobacillus thermosulfidooxidans TaxID=28034 RepID=UPI0006B43A1D|nr:AzlC family ABC transporter permease [Sulfobacillus thermosulfidooxidans]
MHSKTHRVLTALQEGFPIYLGYLPPSMAFGMTAQQYHWLPWQILATSAILYAGTSQFVLLSLISMHASLWSSAMTVWLINLRHVTYGPALTLASKRKRSVKEILLIGWGLTDEVFATICRPFYCEDDQKSATFYLLTIALIAYGGWLSGTIMGVFFGQAVLREIPHASLALNFALPALFIFILTTSLFHHRRWHLGSLRVLGMALGFYVIAKSLNWGMTSVLVAAILASTIEVLWQEHGQMWHEAG